MKTPTLITATILSLGLFMAGQAPLADGHCTRSAQTFKLMIKLSNNKPVEVTHKGQDAENFHVCMGDSIEWKIAGPGRKDFYINFEDRVPTSGPAEKSSNNGKILVTIDGGEAEAGSSYKYLIGVVGGGEWDPRVIVDR